MKVAGDIGLGFILELLQRQDVEGYVLDRLREIVPFETLRELGDWRIWKNTSGGTGDNDVRHVCVKVEKKRQKDEMVRDRRSRTRWMWRRMWRWVLIRWQG